MCLYLHDICNTSSTRSTHARFSLSPLFGTLCHFATFARTLGLGLRPPLAPNKLNSSNSSTGTYPLLFPPPPPPPLRLLVIVFPFKVTLNSPHSVSAFISDVLPSWQMGFHPFPNFQVRCIDPLSAIPAHTVEPIIIFSTVYSMTRQGSQ
ncbi:hypothetical protein EV424DRAFT_1093420 [Suillus variegatus]|nr:hypothetical protein EV424DRAFT_1093420 [Suillus variegatus]